MKIKKFAKSMLCILLTAVMLFSASSCGQIKEAFEDLTGTSMKKSVAMSLNDYEVTGNMLTYYFVTTYNNFLNNYSSYLSYISLDRSKSLKNQEFNPTGSYDSMLLGEFEGTWFDYFMNDTKESIKNLLFYCAEADNLGIELNEEDQKEIDKSFTSLISSVQIEGATTDNIIKAYYGNEMTKDDIRKAMELSALASKVAQHISDDIENNIDLITVENEYLSNRLNYDVVDTNIYDFEVNINDIIAERYGEGMNFNNLTATEKENVLSAYKEKIKKARESAASLAAVTTSQGFINWVVEYATNNLYDEVLSDAIQINSTFDKPSESDLAKIKEQMIHNIIHEVANGIEPTNPVIQSTSNTYSIYNITISEKFAQAAKSLKEELYEAVDYEKNYAIQEKINYLAPSKENDYQKDEFSEWAFNSERKIGDITIIEEGDNANGAELNSYTVSGSFVISVILMNKTAYKDETLIKSIAYMMFDTEADAKSAIGAIQKVKNLNKDSFLDAIDNNAYEGYIEAYLEGTDNSDADLDKWLETAKKGDFTTAPIAMTGSSYTTYTIAYYEKDIVSWHYTVKSTIYDNNYSNYENRLKEDFTPSLVLNEAIINRVDIPTSK